jgi:hypothetical protein
MKFLLRSILLLMTVSACVGPPQNRPRDRSGLAVPAPVDLRQCLSGLSGQSARYTLVQGRDLGNGCTNASTVQLSSVGIPITNVTAIQCPLARALTSWTQGPVQAAASKYIGSRVVRLESMGAYSCRNVIGRPQAAGQRSEHATGNAVDIGGFVFADGRRITVQNGWKGSGDEQAFLREVRAASCKRFQTVLSPDYNAAHHDHLHFDMGRGPYCR